MDSSGELALLNESYQTAWAARQQCVTYRTEQGMILTRAGAGEKGRSIYMSLARLLGKPSNRLLLMS